MSIPIRVKEPPTHSKVKIMKRIHVEWSSVGQSNVHNCYCFRRKQDVRQLLERHPFSGRCDSAGELLHTPYADSNFHGHRPAVCTTRNTLLLIGRLEQIGLSPAYLENVRLNPSSPVLLTRNGPLRIFDTLEAFDSKKIQSKA